MYVCMCVRMYVSIYSLFSFYLSPICTQFLTMKQSGQIKSYTCIYERSTQSYHTVFELGHDVCGFPTVVHGGLSATICDETLGGLLFSLKLENKIQSGPAFTARLEVDYRARVAASSLVVCSARLEQVDGRKVWMTCTTHDGHGPQGPDHGGGKIYVQGRALFVHPRADKLVKEGLKMVPKIASQFISSKLGNTAKSD